MTSKPNKIFLFVLFLCANLSIVLGQQIYHVSPNGSETADGLSWANSVSFKRALMLTQNGDEVWMKEGNYIVSQTYAVNRKITILGGFDGTETSANQRDWENNVVNLDGNNNKRIMKVNGNEVVIDGITFKRGHTSEEGGAIYSNPFSINPELYIINCTFLNNYAGEDGGAIYRRGEGNITVVNSVFTSNFSNSGGGAFYVEIMDNVQLDNCQFNDNSATDEGAAINFEELVSAQITDCEFNNNTAEDSGGVIHLLYTTEEVIISNCEFNNNTSENSGGVLYLYYSEQVIITDCDFNNNSSDVHGGVIYAYNADLLEINSSNFTNNSGNNSGGAMRLLYSNIKINSSEFSYNSSGDEGTISTSFCDIEIGFCEFTNNEAEQGGALDLFYTSANIYNSSFINNSTTLFGGAILIYNTSQAIKINKTIFRGNSANIGGGISLKVNGNLDLSNLVFKNNSATEQGGAIYSERKLYISNSTFYKNAGTAIIQEKFGTMENKIYNSIFYGNTPTSVFPSAHPDIESAFESHNFNSTQMIMKKNILQVTPNDGLSQNNIIGVDPLFVNPAAHNFSLTANSPAANVGGNSLYQQITGVSANSDTDIIGNDRVFNTIIDMGAYELQEESLYLSCSNITLPTDEETEVAIDTNISWSAVSDATGYTLQIGTSSGASDILNQNVGNVTTYDLTSDLDYGTTYYVNIIPYNDQTTAVNCTEYTFTTEESIVLDCTSINLPTDGQTEVAIDTNISWNAVNNATGYTLQIGTSSGASDILNQNVGNVTTYDLSMDLNYGTTYYVTIIPYNDQTTAVDCTEYTFITEEWIVPDCSSITLPTDAQTGVAIDTNISWSAVSDATGYTLQIGTSSGASDVFNQNVGNVTTYDLPTDLNYGTTYYVTIIPYNDQTTAVKCTEYTFTTEEKNIVPYNVITPNGDGLNDVIDYSFLLEYENVFMQIYDRYGKIVFEGNQANNYIWDGFYFSKPLPTDTYWMVLQWTQEGEIKEKQGYLMLKNHH